MQRSAARARRQFARMIEQGAMLGTGDAQTASDVAVRTSQGHPGNVPMPPMQDKFSHSAESSRELRHERGGALARREEETDLSPYPPPLGTRLSPTALPPFLWNLLLRGNPAVKAGASARSRVPSRQERVMQRLGLYDRPSTLILLHSRNNLSFTNYLLDMETKRLESFAKKKN